MKESVNKKIKGLKQVGEMEIMKQNCVIEI